MKTIAFEQPSATADCATLFVALELSKSKWLVGIHLPGSNKLSEHSVLGGDLGALLALIGKKRKQAEALAGSKVRVVSCFEAGFDGFWLHRALSAHGVENRVIDPASIPMPRRARRKKTDRLDLKGLLRLLMALERGESRACQVVHVPTLTDEDERRRSRERKQLVSERCRHTNRIGGLLMTHGVRGFIPRRRDWQKQLDSLRTWDGQPLPARLTDEIARECERLHLIVKQIAGVEAEQRAAVEQPAAAGTALGRIQNLFKLRGIGLTSAASLEHEVYFRTFGNRRQLGGYIGLGSSPWQSGSVARDQGIAKSGNPRARTLAIELAWLWLRHQPESTLSRWFHTKVGETKGRPRRIAIVALARKLMVALWRYVTIGAIPEGAVFNA
jgi:transposase